MENKKELQVDVKMKMEQVINFLQTRIKTIPIKIKKKPGQWEFIPHDYRYDFTKHLNKQKGEKK